jgi:23S rRNA (cytidine1920-2'-O)/16S rRNA (cytidine1409-2'-O)-methyltransferase
MASAFARVRGVSKVRADRLLVERGIFESRAQAQAAIAAGLVCADGTLVRKASNEIANDAVLSARPAHPWVSRGGVKLAEALNHFRFDPVGRICLDVGASTGGFTEVLLAHGAERVYAVEVGHDQMHPRLRSDSRVTLFEKTDIRALQPGSLPVAPDLVVIDVSFISLKAVLPAALSMAAPRMDLIALIKPQFEVGRRAIKRGVVRDPEAHAVVCADISQFVRSLGCRVVGVIPSPIAGGDGNVEFLIGAVRD